MQASIRFHKEDGDLQALLPTLPGDVCLPTGKGYDIPRPPQAQSYRDVVTTEVSGLNPRAASAQQADFAAGAQSAVLAAGMVRWGFEKSVQPLLF